MPRRKVYSVGVNRLREHGSGSNLGGWARDADEIGLAKSPALLGKPIAG